MTRLGCDGIVDNDVVINLLLSPKVESRLSVDEITGNSGVTN